MPVVPGSRLALLAGIVMGLLLTACGNSRASTAGPVATRVMGEPTNTVAGSSPAPLLGLIVDPGLRVVGVEAGSGAAQAGVLPEDVLVALDGTPLTSAEQGQQVAQATIVG